MKRNNHYEVAFEAFLRAWGIPYVAVDETRRAVPALDETVKSADYIISPERKPYWLVDVKGRRFPAGQKRKQYWRNWSTEDDIKSLTRWESFMGADFQGLLVFAFDVVGEKSPLPREELFSHDERLYAFLGVKLADYREHAKLISPRWRTVALSVERFKQVARPVREIVGIAE